MVSSQHPTGSPIHFPEVASSKGSSGFFKRLWPLIILNLANYLAKTTISIPKITVQAKKLLDFSHDQPLTIFFEGSLSQLVYVCSESTLNSSSNQPTTSNKQQASSLPLASMTSRFTKAEKGKSQLRESQTSTVKRIKAPSLDTSALIKDNALTLIGRLTNPYEQKIWSLIPSLPRKWNLKGRAVGSDLGNGCFQFRFEKEEDLRRVLDNRPYYFAYWMIILQRWEPVISNTFPSLIPFWIRIKGLPLHYWHDDMVCRVGREL